MDNNIAKRPTNKDEVLEDIIPSVIMEITTNLLAEANQLLSFNEDLSAYTLSEIEVVPRNEEAKNIMKEAHLAAEKALRTRFPSIPEILPQRLGMKM